MNVKKREGITVAGCILVDEINQINAYPESGELTQIVHIERAVGGCVPNVAIDLKRIWPELIVNAIGRVGVDENGTFAMHMLKKHGIEVEGILVEKEERTSFTEVMSVIHGQRTFFTYPGTGANLGYEDFCFSKIHSKILHLGYFLLLKTIDEGDGIKVLKKAQDEGIKTSIDLVSENSNRYTLVHPCLPYVDYLIINETEAGELTDMEPIDENLERIARKLKSFGVKDKVIIHKPELSVCLSDDSYTVVNSYVLPDNYIKGTTGAGDAFCAGALVGIYKGWSEKNILEFASACAVMALGRVDATSGLTEESKIKEFCRQFDRRKREVR